MTTVTPFHSPDFAIRAVDISGEAHFVGKDVADALGYANASDAIGHHCKGVAKRYPLQTAGGVQEVRVLTEPDVLRLIVNSTLPAAEKFERWVFEEVLPTIRRTGSYKAPKTGPSSLKLTAEAARAFTPLFRIARLLGCDTNAAAISANQAVMQASNINLLKSLGHTHLESEHQEAQFFTPTELGKRIDLSARGLNLLLAETGMQMRRGDVWEVTDAGREFAKIYDTGKRHGSGVPVTQIKWSANVMPLLIDQKAPA